MCLSILALQAQKDSNILYSLEFCNAEVQELLTSKQKQSRLSSNSGEHACRLGMLSGT